MVVSLSDYMDMWYLLINPYLYTLSITNSPLREIKIFTKLLHFQQDRYLELKGNNPKALFLLVAHRTNGCPTYHVYDAIE